MKILYTFKVPGSAPIKAIQFSKNGHFFLVNSTDRIIRVYEGEDSKTVAREFQDPVNKMQWKKCCFSSDGEYIIGGSAQKSQHNISSQLIVKRIRLLLAELPNGPRKRIPFTYCSTFIYGIENKDN